MSTLPYHQIPEPAKSFSPGNILSRFMDGLGYRYYWATQSLTESDLNYSPSADNKNTLDTLSHIYGISISMMNVVNDEVNVRPASLPVLDFHTTRELTLKNIETISHFFTGKSELELGKHLLKFQFGDTYEEFPLWNMMNGHVSDALYHVGQIVAYRRASGNPIHPEVNVLLGKTAE